MNHASKSRIGSAAKANRRVLLVGLCALSHFAAAASLSVAPVGRQIEVLPPNQEFVWSVEIPPHTSPGAVTWWISGWHSEALTQPATLAAGDKHPQIHYLPTHLGWQQLIVALRDPQGNIIAQIRRGFIAGETRTLALTDFKYGVSSHLIRDGSPLDLGIDLIDKLGVRFVRDEMSWEAIQPHPGAWNWAGTDAMVNAVNAHHLQLNATLDYTTEWASTKPGSASIGVLSPTERSHLATRVMPRMEPWLAFIQSTVSRYKNKVHYWEIWNEPDNGFWQSSVADYVTLFSQTANAIKQTDPNAEVMNGGFCMVSLPPNPSFLRDFLPQADRTNWDIFAYHDYSTFSQQLANTKDLFNLTNEFHIKQPLWMNEGGRRSVGYESEQEQAITLAKRLATAPGLGVGSYIIYSLQDGPDPNVGGGDYGLMHYDFTAKPAYAAYQTLVRLLGSRRFVATLHADSESGAPIWIQAYGDQDTNNRAMAAVWSETGDRASVLWFDHTADAKLFDVMGNPVSAQTYEDGTLLSVHDEPMYLATGKPLQAGPKLVLTSPSLTALASGIESKIEMSFTNPLKEPALLSIHPSAETPGLHLSGDFALNVKPGETVPLIIKARLDATQRAPLKASIKLSFVGMTSTVGLPLEAVQPIVRTNAAQGAVELPAQEGTQQTLSGVTPIVDLYPADSNDALHWHGNSDLSANIRLAYDDQALYMTIEGHDDTHSQHYEGAQLWHGDSLQFTFQPDAGAASSLRMIVALTDKGATTGWIYAAPKDSLLRKGALDPKSLPVAVHRNNATTVYALKIPWTSVGLTAPPLVPFAVSAILNDNDGAVRKQWLQLPPTLFSAGPLPSAPSRVAKTIPDIYP